MQKVELIYLHALLARVHEYLAEGDDVSETFEEYEAIDVGPYQIQRRKGEHEAAARLLAERLAEKVGESEAETEAEREPELPEA